MSIPTNGHAHLTTTDELVALFEDLPTEGTPLDPRIHNWRTSCPDEIKTTPVQARVPDKVVRIMDALLIRAKGYAWDTRSDFVREALWAYCRAITVSLEIRDETLLSLIAERELAARAEFVAQRSQALDQAIQNCRSYLTDLVNDDDTPEIARFLAELAVRIRNIHVRTWRDQWQTALTDLPIMQICVYVITTRGLVAPEEFVRS